MGFDGDGAVGQQDLSGPLEVSACLAGNPADDADHLSKWNGLAKPGSQLDRDAPQLVAVAHADRAPDRLVQHRGGDSAMQSVRVTLMLIPRSEQGHQLVALRLVKGSLQAVFVLQPTDEAHARVGLLSGDLMLHDVTPAKNRG